MTDPNWIDPYEARPDNWGELSPAEQAAWTRGFQAGSRRTLEKMMTAMASVAGGQVAADSEEARGFLSALPKESLPGA